jgi:hypothetical protein
MRACRVLEAAVLCPATMLLLLALLAIVPTITTAAALNATTAGPCAPASCGGLNITYPFWLSGRHSPECGYRAFEVTCDKGEVALEKTYWTYKILDIFYKNSSFTVANVNLSDGTCNNEMVVNVSNDLGPSPFVTSTQNQELFFFYNCSRQARQLPRAWAPVNCANDSAIKSFAWLGGRYRPDANLTQQPGNCTVSSVPVLGYAGAAGPDYRRLVKGGFLLQYMPSMAEDCEHCTATGGRCRVNSTDDMFKCHCPDGVGSLPFFCPEFIDG